MMMDGRQMTQLDFVVPEIDAEQIRYTVSDIRADYWKQKVWTFWEKEQNVSNNYGHSEPAHVTGVQVLPQGDKGESSNGAVPRRISSKYFNQNNYETAN